MHKRKEALAIFTLLGIGGVSAQLNIIKPVIIAHLLMFSSSNIGSCSPCVCECSARGGGSKNSLVGLNAKLLSNFNFNN